MKFLFRLFAIVSCALCVSAEEAPPPAPRIVCEKPEYDFGQADSSQTVTHDYEIKNAGNLTLEIRQVRPSCGCTVAEISQRTLKPGETAQIRASLNLSGRSGRQQKHIMVESNDPQTPTLVLGLQGDIRQDFVVTPERLTPGQISGETPANWEITFQNSSPRAVRVLESHADATNLAVSVSEVEAGKTYKIRVSTMAPMPVGPFNTMIRIKTDNPGRPDFDVPFNAMVMGALVVAPPKLMLANNTNEAVTRFVILRPGTVKEFKVIGIETPDPAMKIEQQPFGIGGIRIQIGGIMAKPELNGKVLKVTTDVPAMKEVAVPFEIIN